VRSGPTFGLMANDLELHQLRDLAQAAEGLGYHAVAFPDHLAYETPGGELDPHHLAYSSMVISALISEATKKLRFGPLVANNLLRHPAVTAQTFMSLDRLSGGRFMAGVGAGWRQREFQMTGLPFPDTTTRLRMLDESLTCMRSLWTNDHTNFAGEFYQLKDAVLWPKPAQKPYPSILMGGSGKGLLRVAAKHADILNVFFEMGTAGHPNIARLTNEVYREKVRFLRDETERCGRPRDAVRICNLIPTTTVTDSKAQTKAAADQIAPVLATAPERVHQSPHALIGNPDECVAELKRRVKEWEISMFLFVPGDPTMLRHLMEEVLLHI
jgi:probable F420-dependent oxidoreductase